MLPLHCESSREVAAPAAALFDYLDDHARLAAHMSTSSWMLAGSRMTINLDTGKGQTVGSHIRLSGRFLGIPLAVDEAVTERTPPARKAWETIGEPRLIVIGPYRMGFEITPSEARSRLRVFIDYALPRGAFSKILGRLLGPTYARWCTESMAGDAAHHFTRTA